MMTDISGQKCLGLFKRSNRPGLLAKTFPALLIGQKGWYSKRCNLIWKLKATKFNRLYFQLQVSVPRTEGIESGLLPTAVASDATTGAIIGKNDKFVITKTGMPRKINQNGTDGSVGLARLGKLGMLPTPLASDIEGGICNPNQISIKNGRYIRTSNTGTEFGAKLRDVAQLLPTPRANKVNGCNLNSENLANRGKGNLEESIAQWVVGMLPTPATRDYKGARSQEALEASGRNQTNSLPDAFAQTGKSFQLNHRFVMEMMGFPPTWCDIYYELAEIAIQKKRQRKKPKR
jgi:hypothetical protein